MAQSKGKQNTETSFHIYGISNVNEHTHTHTDTHTYTHANNIQELGLIKKEKTSYHTKKDPIKTRYLKLATLI